MNEAKLGSVRRVMQTREATLTLVALILFAFFSVTANHFSSLGNIYDMAQTSTFLLIVAVALTFVFIAGEIDLSVGSLYGLCAVVMGLLIVNLGLDPWLAAGLTVGAGLVVGCVTGLTVTAIGVPSFIVTLGMYSGLRGLALVVTGGLPIIYGSGTLDSSWFNVAGGHIGQFPVVILWGAAALAIGALVLKYTVFGAHVYASGGNAQSAKAAGIATNRVKFACFAMSGAACGLIAALQVALVSEADPSTGTGFELQAIAAVIIGGVSLTGGGGSVYGTLVGAAIIGMLPNGLVLLGVTANWNQVFIGLIIVAVGALEIGLSKRRRRRRSEVTSGVDGESAHGLPANQSENSSTTAESRLPSLTTEPKPTTKELSGESVE